MFFTLESDSSNDLKCPHCKQAYYVKWETEYGDPLTGEHNAWCPKCNKDFVFNCEVNVNYSSR